MTISRRNFIKTTLLAGGSMFLPSAYLAASQQTPAYAELAKSGKLAMRVEKAYRILENCELCPRQCGVNRMADERGYCRAPAKVMVFSAHPHHGEEISLTGRKGSGTIFFSNCNLRCVFCQNWPISHKGKGEEIEDGELADMMIDLQERGCHNINLVTPTHVMPNILNAIRIAYNKGLRIPIVYNTSGYERVEILKLLDGIVDIYLPDFKIAEAALADKYLAGASDYPETAKNAILEMNRQVGIHLTDDRGIALRGLMIRHLVMPNRVAGTRKIVKWISEQLPKTTYLNIMFQYRVDYKAYEYPEISRGITSEEYTTAVNWATEYGLRNLDPRSIAVRDKVARTR